MSGDAQHKLSDPKPRFQSESRSPHSQCFLSLPCNWTFLPSLDVRCANHTVQQQGSLSGHAGQAVRPQVPRGATLSLFPMLTVSPSQLRPSLDNRCAHHSFPTAGLMSGDVLDKLSAFLTT